MVVQGGSSQILFRICTRVEKLRKRTVHYNSQAIVKMISFLVLSYTLSRQLDPRWMSCICAAYTVSFQHNDPAPLLTIASSSPARNARRGRMKGRHILSVSDTLCTVESISAHMSSSLTPYSSARATRPAMQRSVGSACPQPTGQSPTPKRDAGKKYWYWTRSITNLCTK